MSSELDHFISFSRVIIRLGCFTTILINLGVLFLAYMELIPKNETQGFIFSTYQLYSIVPIAFSVILLIHFQNEKSSDINSQSKFDQVSSSFKGNEQVFTLLLSNYFKKLISIISSNNAVIALGFIAHYSDKISFTQLSISAAISIILTLLTFPMIDIFILKNKGIIYQKKD